MTDPDRQQRLADAAAAHAIESVEAPGWCSECGVHRVRWPRVKCPSCLEGER